MISVSIKPLDGDREEFRMVVTECVHRDGFSLAQVDLRNIDIDAILKIRIDHDWKDNEK